GKEHLITYQPGVQFVDLGPIFGDTNKPNAINNKGDIVGNFVGLDLYNDPSTGDSFYVPNLHGFIYWAYQPGGPVASVTDLRRYVVPTGIDDSGDVVGMAPRSLLDNTPEPFLLTWPGYPPGQVTDLNAAIANTGWTLSNVFISSNGSIFGEGKSASGG